ncbi:LCP family protein [Halobacillus massiliensis]|uniref:LCP family glycopolymer transferase n=1 Tax=Halobacillus massiliensis TaxID=1926286 RepID=UPI001FE32B6A|nr:LCP family protein [Halobacillus massiliensis]
MKKKWWIIPSIIIGVLMIGVGIFALNHYNHAKTTVNDEMSEDITSIDTVIGEKKLKNQESLSILLMGDDARADEAGRSDALMVLTLDPANDRSQLISIPRDTRTEMVGDSPQAGKMDKINHAYAFGGTDMAVQTVQNLLDINLDYYVRMNMEGMQDMVDALDGITVQNDLDWKDKGFHYHQGELALDGAQTMGFVRMRYEDPNGDFGRTERQRKVIKGIVDKGASAGSVTRIGDILDVLGSNVKTNMDFNTMQKMFTDYRDTRKSMDSYQLQGTGTKIDGIYYMEVSDEEVNKVNDMIQEYHS